MSTAVYINDNAEAGYESTPEDMKTETVVEACYTIYMTECKEKKKHNTGEHEY